MGDSNEEIIRIWKAEDKVPPFQILASIAETKPDWNKAIQMNSRPFPFLKTSIMATIGPSSWEKQTIEDMIDSGMKVARLNFNVGTHESHLETITKIREAIQSYSVKTRCPCHLAIAMDTKGPTIRTGILESDKDIILNTGDIFKLTTDRAFAEHGNEQQIYVDYENIQKTAKVGNIVYVDNGLIRLRVTNIQGNVLTTTVEMGNVLGNNRTVNLPGVEVDLPDITEKDRADFKFAVENGFDMILISFVRNANCVQQVRDLLGKEGKDILILSKIQNQQGLDNIEEIIDASDGIIIVRGVLSIEIPHAKMLQTQKYLLAICSLMGKSTIVSSHFLGTMKDNVKPSSPEANDLANAVNEGAHCIMLTSVTAIGLFPTECVDTAARICRQAESSVWIRNNFDELISWFKDMDNVHIIAISAARLAYLVNAAVILVVTTSGKSAYAISQFQPRCLIIAITTSKVVAKQSRIFKGIVPLVYEENRKSTWRKDIQARIQHGLAFCQSTGLVSTGDPIIIVTPTKHGHPNTVRTIYASIIPDKVYY